MPDSYRDVSVWPALDLEALDEATRSSVERRQRAICAYLQGQPIRAISVDCRLTKTQLLRAFNRCLVLHTDGRIFGWRALIPGSRTREYTRLAPPRNDKKGNAGAFTLFLRTHPEIKFGLDTVILKSVEVDAVRESRSSHREHLGTFRRLCVRAGIPRTVYPLNAVDGGRRAVSAYALKLLRANFAARAAKSGGKDAVSRARVGMGLGERFSSQSPYDLVAIDSHRMNFIGCIGIPTPEGVQVVPIDRLHLIPVIECYSTAILGYHIAIGREPAASDIEKAIRNALSIWKPRRLSLPRLNYPEGASMPSAAIPGLAGVCWNALLLDNASVHYASRIIESGRRRLGCAINFGPVGRWDRRPEVESWFSSLERSGLTRLPNSTGYGPADPQRSDGVVKAVKYQIMLDEMFDLIDILVCTYNAKPRECLGKLSPLEVLSEALLMAPSRWLPRKLPELPISIPELGTLVHTATVRGNSQEGRRPYVQFAGVRYASPVLSSGYELIGSQVRLHVTTEDLRSVKAFLAGGEELGVLMALGGWDRTPHDLALRKAIIRAIDAHELVVGPGEDPVQQFALALAERTVSNYRNRKQSRPTISNDATALTRVVRATQGAIPKVDFDKPLAPSLPAASTFDEELPSFIPKLRHRGTQR